MTGPEHYREAERLVSLIPQRIENLGRGLAGSAEILAEAQVHGTLALAAAQALCQADQPGRVAHYEHEEWNRAAGAWQSADGAGREAGK